MEARTATLFGSGQNLEQAYSWLRAIKRDEAMSSQAFDARMIEERRMMLALMRVGACAIAADDVLRKRIKVASGEEKTALENEVEDLLNHYTAKISTVRKYATPAEFMQFAEKFSAYCIQRYGIQDPADEQEKLWMKYLTTNPVADKLLGLHYSQASYQLRHAEREEIVNFLDFLIATNSWLSIKVILMNLTVEQRIEAINGARYLCHNAFQEGSPDVVKVLLDMGTDPNVFLTFRGFFGDDQTACLFVHLIAQIRSFTGMVERLNAKDGVLIKGDKMPFKLPNVQESIKKAIADLRVITETMIAAGADVDKDEYGYSAFPSDPEHFPRGMAAKTLREHVTSNDKLNDEQKQLLGDVLRLIIDGRKLEPIHGGESAMKKPKN